MMKIAFFGTGLLGGPMAQRLLEAGYRLTVYNRTVARTETLREKGAAVARHPLEAMEKADVFITMLSDYPAIDAVLFADPARQFPGKTWIQMSTISPRESLLLKEKFIGAGGEYMEAPVLGSIPQVETRTLLILFGGTAAQFKRWQRLLKTFGDKVYRLGDVGRAAAVKLALNQLSASFITAFSMSLGYLRENKADIEKFMEIFRDSALYAPAIDKKFNRMMQRDFSNPNFPVKLLLKDVELILAEFNGVNIDTGPLEAVKDILLKAMAMGEGDRDYSALYNAVHPPDISSISEKKIDFHKSFKYTL